MKEKNIYNIFYIFLLFHLLIWLVLPSITNNNLPLDTIEALAWGSNLDWGYDKHPPLSAFAVEIFYLIFGNKDWAYYLLSQLFVISAFFVIFKFSEDFFKNKTYCLVSVLLLEGISFYNFSTPEFNVNVCQLPFWALTVLYCWKGFKNNKIIDWLLFGLFAGLGVLSKYLFIYLLVAMDIFFVYMLFKKKINFKCLVSLITFLLILFPHLIWIVENNYITITYGLHRTGVGGESLIFLNHLKNPFIFLLKQIVVLIPFFLMFLFLVSKFKVKLNYKDKKLLFLLTINIIPLFLMFLTSMLMGVKIRTMWMTPFYLFFGVLLVYIFQSKINLNKLKNFISVFLILFIFSPFAYALISIIDKEKKTDYPGKEISLLVKEKWNKNFNNTITIVVGDEWHGGNLSYHLKPRPKWFSRNDNKIIDFLFYKTDFNAGIIYTGNTYLREVCPGVFENITSQGICMIGIK